MKSTTKAFLGIFLGFNNTYFSQQLGRIPLQDSTITFLGLIQIFPKRGSSDFSHKKAGVGKTEVIVLKKRRITCFHTN